MISVQLLPLWAVGFSEPNKTINEMKEHWPGYTREEMEKFQLGKTIEEIKKIYPNETAEKMKMDIEK